MTSTRPNRPPYPAALDERAWRSIRATIEAALRDGYEARVYPNGGAASVRVFREATPVQTFRPS